MASIYKILVLNIGSITTKVAFFENHHLKLQENIGHDPEQVGASIHYMDQFHLRRQGIVGFLEKHRIARGDLHMIASRGGLTAPIDSGVYLIDEGMCDDLRSGKYGQHPTNLGPIIAHDLAKQTHIRAVIVDSPSSDEYQPFARVSGIPEIKRKSAFHALNQKASARRAADEMGISYEACNMIVAHLGGGITIGAHRRGRVIDSTIGLGEGPMTPERAGALPTVDLLRFLESGRFSVSDLRRRLTSRGGVMAYLGTNDIRRVEAKIQEGDENALLILQAMAYQIAKDIGAMSTVLQGRVDAVVLTGGLANSSRLCAWISKRIGFIASVKVYPGENEMHALAQGALRVLSGTESAKQYSRLEKV
jgi:butyrate kinase